MGGDVARMGEMENAYKILVRKPEGKRKLGSPRIALREIGSSCMEWMYLAEDMDQWRVLVNTIMKLRVP
jgi:hypothetical protein